MRHEIQAAARKVGLGFRPEDVLPASLDEWIKEQLAGQVRFLAEPLDHLICFCIASRGIQKP